MFFNVRKKQWLAGVGILLCGFILGVLTSPLLMQDIFREPPFPPPSRKEIEQRILKRLTNKLDLTETQKKEIMPIIHRSTKQVDDLRQSIEPQIHDVINISMEEINEFLTPQQKEVHIALLKKFEEHYQKMRRRYKNEQ